MKKTLIIIVLFISSTMFSQSGFKHLSVNYGLSHELDKTLEIGIEFNGKYFNSLSMFFAVFQEQHSSNKNVTGGLYYNNNLYASRNNFLNLKIGTSLGTNSINFIIDAIVGLEYEYAITRNMKLGIHFKNNVMFNTDPMYRHSLLGGIKIRL